MMSTLFAVTVVPAADTIYRLGAADTRRAADDAAAGVALAVRDARLRRLDRLVCPALDRIAAGPPFLDSEVAEFLLLEAHLRDTVRAAGVGGGGVGCRCAGGTGAGIRVRLHDDGGLTGTDPVVRERIHRRIVDESDTVTEGVVTVRILPPGRRRAVTLVSSRADAVRRLDLGRDGIATQLADSAQVTE
ncbi:hypothetical protein AB0H71_10000 [Nocardia sp. NPDC050697]|uniref:hypothetical protein n=1 Tax=Nocardia sp. NPDC050697 TaxID=3155158 RepID=UPI0034082CDE